MLFCNIIFPVDLVDGSKTGNNIIILVGIYVFSVIGMIPMTIALPFGILFLFEIMFGED